MEVEGGRSGHVANPIWMSRCARGVTIRCQRLPLGAQRLRADIFQQAARLASRCGTARACGVLVPARRCCRGPSFRDVRGTSSLENSATNLSEKKHASQHQEVICLETVQDANIYLYRACRASEYLQPLSEAESGRKRLVFSQWHALRLDSSRSHGTPLSGPPQ